MNDRRVPAVRSGLLAAGLMALTAATWARPAAAQDGINELRPAVLLRAGFEVEPEAADRGDGFLLYDARLALVGTIGQAFDLRLGVEYDRDDPGLDLLDASASVGLAGDRIHVDLGAFKSPVGREAGVEKRDLRFAERGQATLALAPGRQLGVQVRGAALDTRFSWGVGLFNGDGLALDNVDGGFLAGGRVAFNNVGDLEFAEEFVVEVGLSVATSSDSGRAVLPGARLGPTADGAVSFIDYGQFEGHRFTWGGDVRLAYQGWTLAGEYLRTDYDPEASAEDVHAEGVTLDLRHALWGLFDVGARYDAFTPAVAGPGTDTDAREFLVLGVGLAPALFAELGLQYAIGLDDPGRGVAQAIDGTNTTPPLVDGQFLIFLQLSY